MQRYCIMADSSSLLSTSIVSDPDAVTAIVSIFVITITTSPSFTEDWGESTRRRFFARFPAKNCVHCFSKLCRVSLASPFQRTKLNRRASKPGWHYVLRFSSDNTFPVKDDYKITRKCRNRNAKKIKQRLWEYMKKRIRLSCSVRDIDSRDHVMGSLPWNV